MDIELMLTTEQVQEVGYLDPLVVDPYTPIRTVFRLLKDHHAGGILVCRGGQLVGIFTERDALRLMARHADFDAAIETVMVSKPITVRADSTIGSAILRMSSGGYRRLPVVDGNGQPVGVLPVSGIVHYLVEHFPKSVYNLPPTAHPVMQEREGS